MIRKSFLVLSFLVMCASSALAKQSQSWNQSKNVAKNHSFEDGIKEWQIPSKNVSLSNTAKTGKSSLQFANNDPTSYGLIKQLVKANPGQTIHVSAWIKGKELSTEKENRGAAIYIESSSATGHLGGEYLVPLNGTFDWTRINGSYTVPEKTEEVWIGLYLLRGTTGTAWFDDIEIRIQNPPPLESLLRFPNYRSLTTANNEHPWEVIVSGFLEEKSTLTGIIKSEDDVIVHSQSMEVDDGEYQTTLQWKPQSLKSNNTYMWELEVRGTDKTVLKAQKIPIHVASEMPSVYIDADGFTVVDGKRFFPFGVYDKRVYSANDTHLSRISKAGFNTVLSYRYGAQESANLYLDLAKKNNLHIIYSLKDMHSENITDGVRQASDFVEKLKHHDALLAWYINDELKPQHLPQLQAMHQRVSESDQRPIYQVTNKPYQLPQFFTTSDVLGTDPYPETGGGINRRVRQFNIPSTWTQSTVEAAKSVKGVWQVLQLHDVAYIRNTKQDWPSRPPTLDEMRNYSYQALINGSKGIIYFAYHWLWYDFDEEGKRITNRKTFDKRWSDVQKLSKEIKPLTEIILKDNKVNLKVLSPSSAQYQAWKDGDKLYILVTTAANYDQSENLELEIPVGWQWKQKNPSGMHLQVQNQRLSIELDPAASGTIVLEK